MPPIFFLPLVFWVLVLCGGFMLASRFIRAFEQRGSDRKDADELRSRLTRLEDSLESMSNEMHRLSEAQSFTTRLLEGRGESTSGPGESSGRAP